MKIIKGHTSEIAGLESDPTGRYIATFAVHDSYVNVWDLESAEKTLVTPLFQTNTNIEPAAVHFRDLKKSAALMLVSSKSQVQLYRIKFDDTDSSALKIAASIKDAGNAVLAANFFGKSQLVLIFDLPHGCAFKPMNYLSEDTKKMIKEQLMDSKAEFTKHGLTKSKTESYQQMVDQATVINLAEANPIPAVTSVVPPSVYKGKLAPLIKSAKPATAAGKEKPNAAIGSALTQALKSGDQANLDWALNQDVM